MQKPRSTREMRIKCYCCKKETPYVNIFKMVVDDYTRRNLKRWISLKRRNINICLECAEELI